LSIPVGYDDTIKENYSKIIGEISKLTGITKDRLTRPSMLHLTVLMLPLYKDLEKIMKVKQVLNKLESQIINDYLHGKKEKIYINFKGLGTFAENPAQANNIFFGIK